MSAFSDVVLALFGAAPSVERGPAKEPQRVVNGRAVVRRDQRPLWQQKNWKRSENEYHGYYRNRFGAWKGKITVSLARRVEILIQNPPRAMSKHHKWACFHALDNDWYSIHHHGVKNGDVSSAIVQIESILTEAIKEFGLR
jgi:hypothetical protein